MGTGYRPEKKNLGTDGYRVPGKFSLMPTPVETIKYTMYLIQDRIISP